MSEEALFMILEAIAWRRVRVSVPVLEIFSFVGAQMRSEVFDSLFVPRVDLGRIWLD